MQAVTYNAAFPSLIAAGSANGDLYVWDLSRESGEEEVGKSGSSAADVMHREGVCAVRWAHSSDEAARHAERAKAFVICTVGR